MNPYEEREERLNRVVERLVWLTLLGIGVMGFVLLEVAP